MHRVGLRLISLVDSWKSGLARVACAGLLLASGCSEGDAPQSESSSKPPSKVAQPVVPTPVKPPEPRKEDPREKFAKLAGQTRDQIEAGDLEAALASIDALKQVYEAASTPAANNTPPAATNGGETGNPTQPPAAANQPPAISREEQDQLLALQTLLAERQAVLAESLREEQLAAGRELMDSGKFDEATLAFETVLARSPTDKQRRDAGAYLQEIERRRSAQRRLSATKNLMSRESQSDVQSAQIQLRDEPDTAVPLLLSWVQEAGNPLLVRNTLQSMRAIRRPERLMPGMIGVLKNSEQKANWTDAAQAIVREAAAGAGPALLELAMATSDPEQQAVALTTLAQVVDPPPQTLISVLPLIFLDNAALAPALRAATAGVVAHRQFDLVARRGLEFDLSPELDEQLRKLPERLQSLASTGSPQIAGEPAHAAKVLGVAIRVIQADPLQNIKVDSAGGEFEDGKASAVLDGVWSSVDLPTMWRHPVSKPGTITLDLGEERTVTGIRIWNFNQQGGAHRGWKEVDVFVSNVKSELNPVTSGIIPTAPGAPDTPDYSTLIPVQFARGRYVKLKARNVWNPDTYVGLSEIQVLGF